MSSNELEKYKQLYSEYISEVVELHNLNLSFLNHIGLRTGYALRKQYKKVTKLQKTMQRSTMLVYAENVKKNKEREELSRRNREIAKKLHAQGRYKNDRNNKTTTNNV